MEEIKGLVSVTIPFFNAERFLSETIESVFAQSYTEWELLLVNDGSSDGGTAIARAIAARHPDKVFYLEHPGHSNLGVNAARNLGARRSRGEFLAFLDSDDIWLPAKLEVAVASMAEHAEAGFFFGPTEYWYEWDPVGNGGRKNEVPAVAPGNRIYRPPELLALNMPLGKYGVPCPCSFLLRRWAFERVGGFDESFNPSTYQYYEDVALLSKIYLHIPVYVSNACLDKNRCSRFSMTRQMIPALRHDAARRFFFRWLKDYLRRNPIAHLQIRRAIRKESWFYCLPLPLATLMRRGQWRIARSLGNKER